MNTLIISEELKLGHKTMSTRSENQQRKQRQKEFQERKEYQERLKAEAKKGKRDKARNDDEIDRRGKSED